MHRISPNNPVRRRLFADELDDHANVENFINNLHESGTREKLEKMQKWNFDFEKEIPLEGVYEWYPTNGADWIGVKSPKTTCLDKPIDIEGILQFENELTPRSDKAENQAPLLRKRRKEIGNLPSSRAVKRKISF